MGNHIVSEKEHERDLALSEAIIMLWGRDAWYAYRRADKAKEKWVKTKAMSQPDLEKAYEEDKKKWKKKFPSPKNPYPYADTAEFIKHLRRSYEYRVHVFHEVLDEYKDEDFQNLIDLADFEGGLGYVLSEPAIKRLIAESKERWVINQRLKENKRRPTEEEAERIKKSRIVEEQVRRYMMAINRRSSLNVELNVHKITRMVMNYPWKLGDISKIYRNFSEEVADEASNTDESL